MSLSTKNLKVDSEYTFDNDLLNKNYSNDEESTLDRLGWGNEAQLVYESTKQKLSKGITDTQLLLNDIKNFNSNHWLIHYPQSSIKSINNQDDLNKSSSLHRTLSNDDDLSDVSTYNNHSNNNEPQMQVLRLDLKLGSSSANPTTLVNSLEKSSIATLLDSRLSKSYQHLDSLSNRINDKSSKVLVTGDLNSGKSTFVNAILRRNVMPSNQLPTTTLFCEVHPITEHPQKIEQVHLINSVNDTYSPNDPITFKVYNIEDLEQLCEENETNPNPPLLKIYLNDPRSQDNSLLSNGTVSISLIDAPGLNLDTLSTTALFARQEEIDVIVFVLSAENRLTLSAKEFLVNASHEKSCVFCVVNGWDRISEKNKEKCKNGVLDQLKSISHDTWLDRKDLVHFVDSINVDLNENENSIKFGQLEDSLRNFVLFNRQKSKLAPVSNYLKNLLSDLILLTNVNVNIAKDEIKLAKDEIERVKPIVDMMKKNKEGLQNQLEKIENESIESLRKYTKLNIDRALHDIGNGKSASRKVTLPTYEGILSLYPYSRDVKKALLSSLDYNIKDIENYVREVTNQNVKIVQNFGNESLPENVEKVKRVFVKEAMFNQRSKSTHNSVGINLINNYKNYEISPKEIFDITQFLIFKSNDEDKMDKIEDDEETSFLGAISLAVGAVTMVGGKTMGIKGFIEGAVRLSNLWGIERVRQWAAPAIGVLVVGAATYYIYELPRTIPKSIGSSLKKSLEIVPEPSMAYEENMDNYSQIHQLRVERETRKVLRLASWDVKEKFRATLETHSVEYKKAEEDEMKAKKAIEWFNDVCQRVQTIKTDTLITDNKNKVTTI